MKDDSTELLSVKEDTRKISTVRGSTVSEKTLDSYYKRFEDNNFKKDLQGSISRYMFQTKPWILL